MHLAAEYGWLARTGGLAEAVAGLSATQAAAGIPVAVVIPLHRSVRSAAPALERVAGPFQVQVGPRLEEARLFRIPTEPGKPKVYCIEHPYFDRAGLYGEAGADYPDNLQRWAFFCRAALELLPRITRSPCILHCHDWHTALAPIYLRTYHNDQPFARGIRTVLTVHNAGFQGHFPPSGMPEVGLPWELYNFEYLEWHDQLNLLKGGLKFADAVTTVSPTHAHELRTPVGGFGLHDVFLSLGDRFTGIVNGIDMEEWNPARDEHVNRHLLGGRPHRQVALQGGAAAELRAAPAAADPAVRDDRADDTPEGARTDHRRVHALHARGAVHLPRYR